MKISMRGWIVLGTFSGAALAMMLSAPLAHAQETVTSGTVTSGTATAQTPATEEEEPRLPGQLTEEQLGQMLQAMGLKLTKNQKRYDFAFKTVLQEEEWNLSMSAVLSQDERSVWIMAWLDPLPKSAAEVPRTALLRLLADNDKLGKGKFFAYIAANRRFVMQRTIPNYKLSTAAFKYALKDLGEDVVRTYPHWSVSNWNPKTTPAEPVSQSTEK